MATVPKTPRGTNTDLIAIKKDHGRDAADLAQALSRSIAGEVRFDPASRSLYATDLSIYRHVPIGVVIPAMPTT